MGSKLAKTMILPSFDTLNAKSKSPFEDELIQWIKALYDALQREHRSVRTEADVGGMNTATWRIKEADAADVANGNANAAGDLMIQRKIGGVWQTSQVYRGS